MKKTLIILAAALAAVPTFAQKRGTVPMIRGGVGPVMEASATKADLPQTAQTFLSQLFPGTAVASVKNDFKDNEYDVKMADGYEVTFDRQGNWTQIEAPDGATLPSGTLTAIVPEEIVLTTLSGNDVMTGGAVNAVEEIEVFPGGYVVEYVTGTYGRGKAAIDKTNGKVMTRADRQKARQGKQGKMRRDDRRGDRDHKAKFTRGGRHNGEGQARQVNYQLPRK